MWHWRSLGEHSHPHHRGTEHGEACWEEAHEQILRRIGTDDKFRTLRYLIELRILLFRLNEDPDIRIGIFPACDKQFVHSRMAPFGMFAARRYANVY